MSERLKLPSSSSSPIKKKFSGSSLASASPGKGSKYKNLLAAVLTPSQTKKWLKRKKSNKSEGSSKDNKTDEVIYKGSQLSDDFSEPGYSSIQELQLPQTHLGADLDLSSVSSSKFFKDVPESSDQILKYTDLSSVNTNEEPLYSTVNKERKTKHIHATVASKDDDYSSEKVDLRNPSFSKRNADDSESLNKKLVEEQKEEIKLLVERMKELTKENRELHKNIETIIREEKWKEDSLHAELKLKITQLEAETHKEVKCLSEQIKSLQQERKILSDQMHLLHEENKLLKMKYEDACKKAQYMVSPEFMKKIVDEHEKLLKQIKKKHLEEIKKLQQENEELLESKLSLMSETEELKEKINLILAKNETLRKAEQELSQEKSRLLFQLEESKQMQQEAQNMLLSLLKITETVSIERDVLLNKSSFQDHQQKLLQSTIMDYSLNMGRLQEHISNFSKEKLEELQKLKTGELERDESLKHFYGKQLEMLRSKILNQSLTINDLESEKSKLEVQLESLWQATCSRKSKVEDVKYNA